MRANHHRPSQPRTGLLILLAVISLSAISPEAMAQNRETALLNRIEQQMLDDEIERRLQDHRGQTFGEQLTLDYGASLRFGWAKLDNANFQPYGLRQYEANVYLQATAAGGHRVFGNLRFLYSQYYNSDNSNNGWLDPIGNRYWYQFDLSDWQQSNEGAVGEFDFNIRAGRQFITWGSGLVWSNDLYGVKMRADWDALTIEGLAGVSARSGLYDFDVSRPNYDTDTNRHAYAIRGQYRISPELAPFVAYFIQRDHNSDNVVLPFFGATEFKYNSEYLSFGTDGSIGNQFLYTLELCHESGTGYSTPIISPVGPIQTEENIDAWAGILNMAYLLRDDQLTRIEATLGFGTGDGDRISSSGTIGGNWPGSPDNAFNSVGYINTGLALAPSMTNLLMARVGASTAIPVNPRRPDDLRVGADFFVFGKTTVSAPISAPSTPSRYVGWECDLKVDWRITSDVSFNFRYGLFVPNGGNPGPIDQVRQFVYGGISYAF
ncbi:MAG: alginate export family protein [Phycisphaerales bacterium]|nr:alginate export family protein [Phycisphaerales bacterium]MDP7086433.1 alginate export family protein [Phycisphaerales bacterium]MDP7188545.1 alginate export family protein [Phycisphaerales bacterium]MDP7520329.1 alginate export family protein [Phycisphaerales bacterium]